MTTHIYSLPNTVSFMDMVLKAVGHGDAFVVYSEATRPSLRARLRRGMRLLEQLEKERQAEQALLATAELEYECLRDRGIPETRFLNASCSRIAPCVTLQALFDDRTMLLPSWIGSRPSQSVHVGCTNFANDYLEPISLFPMVRVSTALDMAIRIGVFGLVEVLHALNELWSRRHDLERSKATKARLPRRLPALDRLLRARMWFVLGFFGSHKVDARNNP